MPALQEFDHVVVGGGSAGCAVARRLVDAGYSVALVEAGGSDKHPDIQLPNHAFNLWHGDFDWGFETVPQEHANGTQVYWPRGKVFGGSSSLYGLVFARGAHEDYNSWAYNFAPGWAWEDVLPFFIKLEDYEGGASEYHGVGGPMPVTHNPNPTFLSTVFLKASAEAGLKLTKDCNGPEIMGAGTGSLNVKNGLRWSSWTSYIDPIIDNPLLTVIPNTLVARVELEGTKAVGIVTIQDGKEVIIHSRGDVILSAGSLGSPKLLELSGIGRPEELKRLGIDLVKALPGVGENLHDHFLVPLVYESLIEVAPFELNPSESHLFAKSDERMTAPDLQPIFFPVSMPVRGKEMPEKAFSFLPGVIRPVSRGRMWLTSTDPAVAPSFDPQYLAEEQDMKAMEAAVAICREIAFQPAFDGIIGAELAPGLADTSREGLRNYIRDQILTYHHQVGTARMGLDHLAVVDPELKVYGIEGLRIADCSVIPTVPSANTHAAAVMIGERAADFILSAK